MFGKPKLISSPVINLNNFSILTLFFSYRILGRTHGSAPIERRRRREKQRSSVEVQDECDEDTEAVEEIESQSKGI